MRLLKRHSCPIRDLHNTAKQCQCVNCSAEPGTPHQVRHLNVPVYLSFFLHLPFILFPFPAFFSLFYFFLFSVRFSNYHFHCSFLSLLWNLRPPQEQKTTCMLMALTFKFPANTKTLQCKPRNTLPHTMPVNVKRTYKSDVINRTYNQWERTTLNINRWAVIHTGLDIPCNKSKASDLL